MIIPQDADQCFSMSLAFKPIFSTRPTYTAAYMLVGDELRPKKPTSCIFHKNDAGPCRVTFKDRRYRKIGIEHALFVYGCSGHGVFFTVYPLGWSQYGRRPIVELAPDGSDFDIEVELVSDLDVTCDVGAVAIVDSEDANDLSLGNWQETAFGAAIDASMGQMWPLTAHEVLSVKGPIPYGVFITQQRHIAGVLAIFRLDTKSDDKAREVIASKLPVGFSALKNSADRIRAGPPQDRWRREGIECTTTTQNLTPSRNSLKHLLELGAAVNFWGSPMYG